MHSLSLALCGEGIQRSRRVRGLDLEQVHHDVEKTRTRGRKKEVLRNAKVCGTITWSTVASVLGVTDSVLVHVGLRRRATGMRPWPRHAQYRTVSSIFYSKERRATLR